MEGTLDPHNLKLAMLISDFKKQQLGDNLMCWFLVRDYQLDNAGTIYMSLTSVVRFAVDTRKVLMLLNDLQVVDANVFQASIV